MKDKVKESSSIKKRAVHVKIKVKNPKAPLQITNKVETKAETEKFEKLKEIKQEKQEPKKEDTITAQDKPKQGRPERSSGGSVETKVSTGLVNLERVSAQELLDRSPEELEEQLGKREAHNLLKQMKIITAILLGKKKNKELAQVLDTDKSFTSKQIKSLEEQGLVKREGIGKEVTYEVDQFNVMKFLQGKVVIKWSTKPPQPKAQPIKKLEEKNGTDK